MSGGTVPATAGRDPDPDLLRSTAERAVDPVTVIVGWYLALLTGPLTAGAILLWLSVLTAAATALT